MLSGNEHIVEFNEIHHVVMEGADSGAFYMGRDWSMQGNVIRYNYFHDIGGYGIDNEYIVKPTGPWIYESPHAAWAIYLDDCASGTTVFGNLFVRIPLGAVMIGGGRDNVVENNVIVGSSPAVLLDARWDEYPFWYTDQKDRLEDVNYTQPPYSTRYPNLLKIYEGNPRLPVGNRISTNIVSYSGNVLWEFQNYDAASLAVDKNLIWRNEQAVKVDTGAYKTGHRIGTFADWQGLGFDTASRVGDPGFMDAAADDFRLAADSEALKLGFVPLPLTEIGLYASEFRATWPVAKDGRRDGAAPLTLSVSPAKAR